MALKVREKYKIIGSDFSAQEPRLTAFMSQDPNMIKAYKEGKDLYCVIAAAMFGNKYEDNLEFYPEGTEIELDGKKVICGKKTHLHKAGKERRSAAKTMLLAILYGMSPTTAGARMGKSPEEGRQLMENFFRQFPKVKDLMDSSKQFLIEHEYVEDWAGRRRRLPDINLAPYDAKLAKKDAEQSIFNPFLACENKVTEHPAVTTWKAILAKYVELSNKHQSNKRDGFEKNQEMGNMTFDWLRSIAINPKGMKTKTRYPDKAYNQYKNPYNKDKIKADTGYDIPDEPVILTAWTGKIAQAGRQCLNARIQGGAASLTKLAMVNIFNNEELKKYGAHLIITVHDEVLVECPAIYADEVEKLLPQIMIDTAKPYINVPMSCDPYNVSRWYCDEAAVSIQEEFKKLEAGDAKKGILPLSREEALQKVCHNHIELPPESIRQTIEQGIDLEF